MRRLKRIVAKMGKAYRETKTLPVKVADEALKEVLETVSMAKAETPAMKDTPLQYVEALIADAREGTYGWLLVPRMQQWVGMACRYKTTRDQQERSALRQELLALGLIRRKTCTR